MNPSERSSDVSTVPAGTVSFLFTDIEGSTVGWETYGDAMRLALERHDALMREAISAAHGHVFKTVGDGFCAAFHTTTDAVAAAYAAQRALVFADWSAVDGLRVRMVVHVGAVESRDGDYFGRPLNKIARLLSAAHGGQVVLTEAASHLVAESLPAEARLEHLGSHRLKDLELAEHVYQLLAPDLPAVFPPLRSLDVRPNNLPVQLTSFIGRERELSDLREPFEAGRLLTLAGPGGVGKTRLALALAVDALDRYENGVWFVDLSPLIAGAAVADEVATALSLSVNAKEPIAASIVRALRDQRTLLIFDCCEHVLAATAALVAAILQSCPKVCVLATSRERLRIPGERIHTIGVLDVPPIGIASAADALASSAVRLFVDRARDASSQFALTDANAAAVAEICRRLDGIALAIELAASKVAMLSPRQLAERLNERFSLLAGGSRVALPRQQTLRALIDWSYDLLDDDERRVFRRLTAFAGSFSLDAASALCAADAMDAWRVIDILAALVAKSLVVVEPAGDEQRYRLLDSMHEYGRERLRAAGEEEAVGRDHARFYRGLNEQAERTAGERAAWARLVAPEIDNIRAALQWAFGPQGEPDVGLGLLAHLDWAPLIVTPQEAARWFAAGCEAITPDTDPELAARVLNRCAFAQWYTDASIQQRHATALRAVETAKRSGVDELIVGALTRLGSCLCDSGRTGEADATYREAAAIADSCQAATVAALERSWGINDLQRGDLDGARRRFTRVAQLEPAGSEGRGSALLNLGEVEFASGNLDAALLSARQAKCIYEELKAPWLALLACNLGAYALAADRLDEAAGSLHEALALLEKSGAGWLTTTLEHYALLAALRNDDQHAARLLGYTQAQYRAGGRERESTEQSGFQRLSELLQSRFTAAELATLFDAGATLSEGEAIAHAIAVERAIGNLSSPA